MPVEDGSEGVGEIVGRVHAGLLASGDERRECGSVFGADFVSGEESVHSGQRDREDLVLDSLVVEFEGAIVEEADQAGCTRV